MIPECDILVTVKTTTGNHDIFNKEFIIKTRSVINFVCLSKNKTTENTVITIL